MAGNFFATSKDLTLEDGHVLKAHLRSVNGEWNEATIDLNDHIGNQDGHFSWDSAGFAKSAEDARVSVEGDGPVFVLRARLRDDNGDYKDADLNLSERLANENGKFGWTN